MKFYKVRIYRNDNNEEYIQEFDNLNSAKAYARKHVKTSMPWVKHQILTQDNKLVYEVEQIGFHIEFIKEMN